MFGGQCQAAPVFWSCSCSSDTRIPELAPLRLACKIKPMRYPNPILSTMLVVMVCGSLSLNAQSPAKSNQVAKSFSRTVTHEEKLDYLLFLPKGYDLLPCRFELDLLRCPPQ